MITDIIAESKRLLASAVNSARDEETGYIDYVEACDYLAQLLSNYNGLTKEQSIDMATAMNEVEQDNFKELASHLAVMVAQAREVA